MGENSRFSSPRDLTMMETTRILEYHDDKREVLYAGVDAHIFEIRLQRNLNGNSPMSAVIGPPGLPTMLTCVVKIFIGNPLMNAVVGPLDICEKDVLQLGIRSFELRAPPPWTKIKSRMCSRVHHSSIQTTHYASSILWKSLEAFISHPESSMYVHHQTGERKNVRPSMYGFCFVGVLLLPVN